MTATSLADYFPASYRDSRERLLERAHHLSSRHDVLIDSRALQHRGPSDETLTLDFVLFGARRPQQVLVLSCGTHGVEGFVGAALQHWALDVLLPALQLAPQTAIVLQHGNNPYGFAWHRRVNENNVDYNRNFREQFDPQQCSADYEQLFDAINPRDLNADNEARRHQQMSAFAAEHGARRFQQVLSEGQYKYRQGLQFGGQAAQVGVSHLLALAAEYLAQAKSIIWLDFHTGLGSFGDCELISSLAPDSAIYQRAQQVWCHQVRSASAGQTLSTPLHGVMDGGLARVLARVPQFAFAFPEYGTYPTERVMGAMRVDNWLHHYGDPNDATGRQIKAAILEAFSPRSRDWRERVVATGIGYIEQALVQLTGARRLT